MSNELGDRIEERLAALESQASRTARQNRLLKVCLLLVPAAFLLGAAAQRRDVEAGTLTAERLVLKGPDGKVRGRLGVDPQGRTLFELLRAEERPAFRVMVTDGPNPLTSLFVLSPEGKASVSAIAAGSNTSLAVRGPSQKCWFYMGKRDPQAAPKLEVFDEQGNAVVGQIGGR
jgi:hypothetical protein